MCTFSIFFIWKALKFMLVFFLWKSLWKFIHQGHKNISAIFSPGSSANKSSHTERENTITIFWLHRETSQAWNLVVYYSKLTLNVIQNVLTLSHMPYVQYHMSICSGSVKFDIWCIFFFFITETHVRKQQAITVTHNRQTQSSMPVREYAVLAFCSIKVCQLPEKILKDIFFL